MQEGVEKPVVIVLCAGSGWQELSVLGVRFAQQPPAAGPSELTVTLTTDKTDYVLGEEVQAEVTLTNSGTRDKGEPPVCVIST